jgi:hypothetical protein
MSVIYGGLAAEDPTILLQECHDRNYPVDNWLGRVNQFVVPTGKGPGTGAVLLRLSKLAHLAPARSASVTPAYDLEFTDELGRVVTFKKISILNYKALEPGLRDSDEGVFLVELVDRRHFLKEPTDRAFNVSSADGASFLASTLTGGSPYTWQQVLDALWTDAGLGTAPSLPFTPHNRPENLQYYGWYAWDAVCDFLDRIACRVKYDPTADTFSLVRLGANVAAADRALEALEDGVQRVWDTYPGEPEYAWRPKKIRVLFPRRPAPTAGTSPYYSHDITLAAANGVTGGMVILHDDLTALAATGAPTNAATLTTRAQERADDWLRKRQYHDAPLMVVYRDQQADAVAKVLGARASAAAHHDLGTPTGGRTEVRARPDGSLEAWEPLREGAPAGASVGITVQEADGSPNLGGISTLIFDQVDGCVVSNPAPGSARIDLQAATTTQAGIVSTTAQSFGGLKQFMNGASAFGTGAGTIDGCSLYSAADIVGGDAFFLSKEAELDRTGGGAYVTLGCTVDNWHTPRLGRQTCFYNGVWTNTLDNFPPNARPATWTWVINLYNSIFPDRCLFVDWIVFFDPVDGMNMIGPAMNITNLGGGGVFAIQTGYAANGKRGLTTVAGGLEFTGGILTGGNTNGGVIDGGGF